ncbi:MAG TPA: hypothetical protein DEG17_15165 [Cyanobacteria bacterium UBA11149]|nr:hypothetical protein [Cyanobacteria bacterium UBA11367]HBE56311.1 hypothetical protein [Cyanobacteria bacterium UBA11366]HBK64044.1 hypothetical protein [Cyanobacteria bacterium UBA11166]HBR72562.1 hypothetical protein [Cyanobacteria bacterium UBA11159]HBS71659.1 hypothetical protein [Cyanobacteria bacterium UBA11153]HBW90173.1 hypothetical protein [Cyanobacteria bacterium UBA11149]
MRKLTHPTDSTCIRQCLGSAIKAQELILTCYMEEGCKKLDTQLLEEVRYLEKENVKNHKPIYD